MTTLSGTVALEATQDWSVLNMLPLTFEVDANDEKCEILLPSIADIPSGQTFLSIALPAATGKGKESTTISAADDELINNDANIVIAYDYDGVVRLSILGGQWVLEFVSLVPMRPAE